MSSNSFKSLVLAWDCKGGVHAHSETGIGGTVTQHDAVVVVMVVMVVVVVVILRSGGGGYGDVCW
jgi:hypothetical protein